MAEVGKVAYLFPGQGSQRVGMGRDLYEAYPAAREVFDEADHVLGFPLSRLCFEGPEETLTDTVNTQPALFTASRACWCAVESAAPGAFSAPSFLAGHSLGHPVRAIKNPMTRQFAAMEKEGISEEELIELGTGKLRLAVEEGDMAWGSVMAGQISGLICDVLSAAEIIRRMVTEAEAILSQRLPSLVVAS